MMRLAALLAASATAFHGPGRRLTKAPVAIARRLTKAPVAAAGVANAPAAAVAPRQSTALYASNDDEEKRLPWFFDPGTYGGVIVLTIFLIVAPLALKSALEASGMDGNQVGVALSGVFVIGGSLLWAFSYVFRVFSKDMTYSTQLKQYEDAVIQKRFEELEDDEVDALLGDIERESAL
jgi:hypothetical protein